MLSLLLSVGEIVMNREAIFCDETEDYRIPLEPMPGEVVSAW